VWPKGLAPYSVVPVRKSKKTHSYGLESAGSATVLPIQGSGRLRQPLNPGLPPEDMIVAALNRAIRKPLSDNYLMFFTGVRMMVQFGIV